MRAFNESIFVYKAYLTLRCLFLIKLQKYRPEERNDIAKLCVPLNEFRIQPDVINVFVRRRLKNLRSYKEMYGPISTSTTQKLKLWFMKPSYSPSVALKGPNISPVTKLHKHLKCLESILIGKDFLRKVDIINEERYKQWSQWRSLHISCCDIACNTQQFAPHNFQV